MNKNDGNKSDNRKINCNNSTNAQEPSQPRSYLANLFKVPADPTDAEVERAKHFGYTPRNTGANGSFTK
ncbi:Hypothetical protein DPCES_1640 [Desulfitobacterium hafniense]|uniref:Uncharacterized protein n=1 Tax=Desulfitobacterium hafniense TaxID=49338 RepID=A0A098AZI3_DESHA|nr:hypothetical protein [Desulfitobacterium hafniense]CDX01527.1 Hypothetical protein DPCES_1640 [Desulfitobacterium hafniense]